MVWKTKFTFTNRGGDVAHNIQVQPLVVDHLTVVFDPIAIIAVNETKGTLPKIPGGIVPRHDILAPMEREWNKAFLNAGIPEGQKIEEWVKQVTVTYEDFAGKQFEVTADLVVFPVQRTLRDKHALENSRRQYKTVEVRNIKFRLVK